MTYSESGFEILLAGNTLRFSGKLEKSEYSTVEDFLHKVEQALTSELCVIDLNALAFLNSRGIRTLARFILGSPKRFELRINSEIGWQQQSIPSLTDLRPDRITIVSL